MPDRRFWQAGYAWELGITEDDVEPKQLEMGIDVEMEHTDDPEIAMRIALDHLAEHPYYYDALLEMERRLEEEEYYAG